MEETEVNDFSQGTVTFCRSKHKLSIVAWWYLRLLLMSIVLSLFLFVVEFFFDDQYGQSTALVWIAIIVSSFVALCYSLINKGSLVDKITIDHQKQEIRVQRYNMFKRERRVTIPFDGFSWNVLKGGRSQDRLRLFPKTGRRIIICEDSLGWTQKDCDRLKKALEKITPREIILFGRNA